MRCNMTPVRRSRYADPRFLSNTLGSGSITASLAAVGRMALTNYLATTVICTTLFDGYGFGLFGELQRWQLYLVVPAIWALQLVASPIWFRYYLFGPMEWFWRSLTYWKEQPLMREA